MENLALKFKSDTGQALTSVPLESDSLPAITSRDEMNLAEFPLAVLSTRTDPKVKTLEFRDTQRLYNGEIIERQWIITGADKFGLPTSTDDDVLLGLMRLTMDQGFRDRKVFFTRYELLQILQWSTEGRSYSRLTKSLDRLSGVRIRAANAFFDNNLKAFQTKNFGIIDAYEINDGRGAKSLNRTEEMRSYFIWSEALFDSFRAGFIKKLDLSLYFSLSSAVSRRLYRYLDKHFYYKSTVDRPLVSFAFDKLGLSRNYKYISQIKQQIEPACEELLKLQFLSRFDFEGRGADTVIRFSAGGQAQNGRVLSPPSKVSDGFAAKHQEQKSRESASQSETLVEALLSRGIHLAQAKRLIQERNAIDLQQIDRIISYYDYLVSTNDQKISRNRIGFLYRAVENPQRFILPRSFLEGSNVSNYSKGQGMESSRRPERQLFSASLRSAQKQNFPKAPRRTVKREENRDAYRAFVDREIERFRQALASEKLNELLQETERKMQCFKSLLDPVSFQKAVDGCVKDELAKWAKVPSFENWLRGLSS